MAYRFLFEFDVSFFFVFPSDWNVNASFHFRSPCVFRFVVNTSREPHLGIQVTESNELYRIGLSLSIL